ncbi:TRAP transporter small permease [Shumkonia mesophila]|uniref:TRAP transporter small permease n=1 Tax=Shumkonia mesophila TaxID=2838854 RepID=UPI002934150C|nr:TRAP transporter small permease [Shumkonia mesophila]
MDEAPIKKTSPEGWTAAGLLLGVFLVILLQILSRYLPLPAPVWTEELSRWLWVWLVFVGIAEVERTDAHLKMDLLAPLLPPRFRTLIFLAIDLLSLVVFVELIRIGYKGAVRSMDATSVTLPVTMVFFYAAYPVAGVFIVLRVMQRIVRRLRGLGGQSGTGNR